MEVVKELTLHPLNNHGEARVNQCEEEGVVGVTHNRGVTLSTECLKAGSKQEGINIFNKGGAGLNNFLATNNNISTVGNLSTLNN